MHSKRVILLATHIKGNAVCHPKMVYYILAKTYVLKNDYHVIFIRERCDQNLNRLTHICILSIHDVYEVYHILLLC